MRKRMRKRMRKITKQASCFTLLHFGVASNLDKFAKTLKHFNLTINNHNQSIMYLNFSSLVQTVKKRETSGKDKE